MIIDVDAWALDCREKITRIFRTRGAIMPGAHILATIDSTTGEELPTPQTWTQYFHEYGSLREFEQALRIQCARTRALAAVTFTEGVRMARGMPIYPILVFVYERRGRVAQTKWAARTYPDHTIAEFTDASSIPQYNGVPSVLPPVN